VGWIVVAAWGFAVVIAVVLLGFGAYELSWKRTRLVRDLAVLRADAEQLNALGAQLVAAQRRPTQSGA
jgi:hypothetical protein